MFKVPYFPVSSPRSSAYNGQSPLSFKCIKGASVVRYRKRSLRCQSKHPSPKHCRPKHFFTDLKSRIRTMFTTVCKSLWEKSRSNLKSRLLRFFSVSKMKYVKLIQNGRSKMVDSFSSFFDNKGRHQDTIASVKDNSCVSQLLDFILLLPFSVLF